MRTIEYLFGPDAHLYGFWPPVVVGLLVALLCSVLSVVVVLKRMSFIGQGVSHAAFAGVGLAMALGLGGEAGGSGYWSVMAVVAAACVAAALGIAFLSDRKGVNADTAIGMVLVAAMAVGFILIQQASTAMRARGETPAPVESLLFGSMYGVGPGDVAVACVTVAAELVIVWWCRRRVLYWAFDDVSASSCGVNAAASRTLLLVLLALAIVLTMRLAGVVLATALLVLPGATALRCGTRLWTVVGLSVGAGVAAVVGGMVASFELNWPPGPSIVLAGVALYALARLIGKPAPARGA